MKGDSGRASTKTCCIPVFVLQTQLPACLRVCLSVLWRGRPSALHSRIIATSAGMKQAGLVLVMKVYRSMMVRCSVFVGVYYYIQNGFWARFVGDKDSRSVFIRLHVEEDWSFTSTSTYTFQTSRGRLGGGEMFL